jgi:hypothetical protein
MLALKAGASGEGAGSAPQKQEAPMVEPTPSHLSPEQRERLEQLRPSYSGAMPKESKAAKKARKAAAKEAARNLAARIMAGEVPDFLLLNLIG